MLLSFQKIQSWFLSLENWASYACFWKWGLTYSSSKWGLTYCFPKWGLTYSSPKRGLTFDTLSVKMCKYRIGNIFYTHIWGFCEFCGNFYRGPHFTRFWQSPHFIRFVSMHVLTGCMREYLCPFKIHCLRLGKVQSMRYNLTEHVKIHVSTFLGQFWKWGLTYLHTYYT